MIKLNETSEVLETLKELLDNKQFTNYYLKETKSFKVKSITQSTEHWVYECNILFKF